jgi:inorganic pyrophosphatase
MPNLLELPVRAKSGAFHAVVESPRGATSKLKYDPELSVFTVSRPLPLGFRYPYDFGFVPRTRAEDGDAVDVLILSDATSYPGVVVPCRALGLIKLEQDSKSLQARVRNDRVIAVPVNAPRTEGLDDADGLTDRFRRELEYFFVSVVSFEPKNARVLGWEDAAAAERFIDASTLPG